MMASDRCTVGNADRRAADRAPIVIRAARPADAPHIVSFQIAMARETECIALDPDTVRRGVQAVFDDPAKGTYWVAERGAEPVASLLCLPEWSDWRNGTVLWIHSLYVVPDARREGVCAALYAHLARMVAERPDLKGLRLYVDLRTAAAQAAYRSFGMTDEHYRMFEWLK